MRARATGSLLAIGLAAIAVAGCEVDTWTEKCSTDTALRSCDISVSGSKFNDLPFPVSGPVLGNIGDRFRLESATEGGSATFSAGGTEGGTFTCEQGQSVPVGDSSIECRSVGDGSLDFTIERVR